MASASPQALPIEQFVCGASLRERQRRAHLLDTRIGSGLWHSHQMASASSQARAIEQFVCGTPRRERQQQAHSLDTWIQSGPWYSHQMASALPQALLIEQFVWNATMEETAASPYIGHTDPVESVGFSPDGQCIVSSGDRSICMLNVTTGNTETTRHVHFTDHSVINEEGWICGSEGQLLMWIPPLHRAHLHRPSNIWVAGEYETRIDLSTFVHGRSWTTCITVTL